MSKKLDILLADLKIQIEHEFDFMAGFCKKYVADFDAPDITAKVTQDAVLKEKEAVPTADIGVCESLCIYRDIAEQLPKFNRFVFHGAAIECDGKGYIFTAPSGTGKTTHINLWKKNLRDRVDIINGDKPIIKLDDKITVYGTPWAGKEGLYRNAHAQLCAICILKQGNTNKITQLDKSAAINHLMRQVYLPQNADACEKTLELIGKVIESTPVYLLECDISNDAFLAAYEKMVK